MLPKTNVSKDLGLATDLTNTSGRSASRAMPQARLTYCLQLDCTYVSDPLKSCENLLICSQDPSESSQILSNTINIYEKILDSAWLHLMEFHRIGKSQMDLGSIRKDLRRFQGI